MKTNDIGKRISQLRKEINLTQSQLAKLLGTSQSAVTRMEAGRQNLSIKMIDRLSQVLGKSLVAEQSSGSNFHIIGGKQLSGEVTLKCSKNATVGLLAASLLNSAPTTLEDVPRIEEVFRILEVLQSIGVECQWIDDTKLKLTPPATFTLDKINRASARQTRTIIMFLAPLMHRIGNFTIPAPGGCKLGSRSIHPHITMLKAFGLTITQTGTNFHCEYSRNKPQEVLLLEPGDTVTENALMAAALTPGITKLKYVSANYMVQDMCIFLQQLGVTIEGIGTTTLVVHGVESIDRPITYAPSEDPIEAMFFIALAIATKSKLTIKRAPLEFIENELMVLTEMGQEYDTAHPQTAKNGFTKLIDLTIKPSSLRAPKEKIHARPYPALNIDNLPFFVPIAAMAEGRTLIHDWVFENRAIYYTELSKLGARIDLADPHRVFVNGPVKWHATNIDAPPALRPSAIIMIAMLAANGESILRNVYSINRGYEDLARRLNAIGAEIVVT